ncbi:tenascin isoform X1 [Mugil cephalus]|uniref:tenascin isoform X1 n=1 Tax=Mugil cephalus TaxID=48193 RepID=UPI001FB6C59D|nr:tenascin isoform X1 [Mugil cephalus]
MLPFIPSLLLILLRVDPGLLTSTEVQVRGERTPREAKQDSIKVVISEGCVSQGDSSDLSQGGKEVDLAPGSPLVLTHKIKLVPSGSGSGSCGCEADFAALRERLERLEREVSDLREKCGGAEGSCCTSKESKGAGCSIKPEAGECPNECSDQGRCVDGKCVCFPGFRGPDCSESDCPGNCNDNGKCVNGQCVCDPGFTGPDCSQKACPDNCNRRGRCVNGQCVCNPGFTGPDCSKKACPDNCNNRGQCVNGKCVCDSGFTGTDCSENACPGNCNNRGRCVNGQCVCKVGFTGPDCSERACPDNCNNRGRCVDGKCECESGFTGPDCSELACPGNCNNRGRCVDGQCVCDEGFAGEDCSERTCPDDCNDRGRCVDGKCECESGFTGDDCSELACPGNCNNRGRCVNGQCVCKEGFTGDDCSEKTCPSNCNNRGKCVNGKCVCDVGFAGPDCATKGCPNNCNNKGRCVRGSCVCRRGFTGPDCSQCQEGMTGPNCDTVMSGVSRLSSRDVTETSVTLVWTPPAVQYETYHITFTSQKESDQRITVQAEGSLTSFTQTGLAAGQEYSVSIIGEIDGRRGAESTTEFVTLISGPADLQVVKTTTTSVVVQWEQSQGEIDRYLLTVTPNDGEGRSQEMVISAGQNSAHIGQLEAGRLYDVVLVSEKGTGRSEPATTQAVPGKSLPRVNTAALTMPGQDVNRKDQDLKQSPEVGQPERVEEGSEAESGKVSPSASVIARTGPPVTKMNAKNVTRFRFTGRPTLSGKPKIPGSGRFNATRVAPGGRRIFPLRKAPVVAMKDQMNKKTDVPTIGESDRNLSVEENPALISGTDSEINSQSSSEVQTAAVGSKELPDVGIAMHGKDSDAVSPEPTGSAESQEKKCMNKIKVTHFRFPQKDKGSGCKEDGTGLAGNTLSSDPGTPVINETPPSGEISVDASPDPFDKLLTDAFEGLNITMFSVHLSKPTNLSVDAASKQILMRMKPLTPFSSSSSSLSSSHSSYSESSSAVSSAPSPSSPLSSLDSQESNKLDVDNSKTDSTQPPLGDDGAPIFSRASPKGGHVRRLHPISSFQNRTRVHQRFPTRGSIAPRRQTTHLPTSELLSSSASDESSSSSSSSVEAYESVKDTKGDKDDSNSTGSHEVQQNQKKIMIQKGQPPGRRFPNGGHSRRPFVNRPHLRPLTQPLRPLNPETETQNEPVFPTELPATSSPISKDVHVSDTGSEREGERDSEGSVGQRISMTSTQVDQAVRHGEVPSSHHPNTKDGYFRRVYDGSLRNRTRPNLRPLQLPLRDPKRKPFPTRNINAGSRFTVGSQTSQQGEDNTPESRSGELDVHEVPVKQSEEQEVSPAVQIDRHNTVRPQTNELAEGDDALVQKEQTSATGSHTRKDIVKGRPTSSSSKGSRPVSLPKRQPPIRGTMTQQHHTEKKPFISERQKYKDPQTDPTANKVSESEQTTGDTREPLDFVGVTNRTSDGFTLIWDAPQGKYKNFVVTRKEGKRLMERTQEQEEDPDKESAMEKGTPQPTTGSREDDNRAPESLVTQHPSIHSSTKPKPTESDTTFKRVLPGSARSLQFEDLPPKTDYTLTLLGKGPGLLSSLHKLVISTGPEPPTNIVFSKVTENSMTVSWTKPKSSVSGFKVTYTHTDEGEPVSVSVDSQNSSLLLSQLSPGSSYEVNIISTLGLDESDPARDLAMTLPDPPTDVRAVNVTDSTALLLWRPALAAIDKYSIVYGSGSGPQVRVTVSGNAAEQQLSGLDGSTTYTVTVTSQLGGLESSPASTSFTTTSRDSGQDEDGPRDLQAKNVTPRTALLSWKPPSQPVGRYRLTYQTEGHETKEVIVGGTVTQYNLTRLHPGSMYAVQLQAESGGRYTTAISTQFTTGVLRFPFPSDCSQELLNGIMTSGEVEIFPHGKEGTPITVYCDMETDGGGWTVFQRRKDGSVDFFRNWKAYVKGFGDLNGEFWLGLDSLHNLTAMKTMILRVDLRDGDESVFAQYSTFAVAKRNYKLTVGGYSGTAGDSLSYHNNRIFSTKDRDPMSFITSCALSYRGGWWYKNCHEANLNGVYGIDINHQGVIWTSWKGKEFSIPFTEMKMRPAAFRPPARGPN